MITSFIGKYRFLSNFAPSPFTMPWDKGGFTFPDAEHAYQAAKAGNDLDMMVKIAMAPTPGEAKRLGRKVPLPSGWEAAKKSLMLQILMAKFSLPEFRARLLVTAPEKLVEGNDWGDTYWGACTELKAPQFGAGLPKWHADDGIIFYGRNWLGRLLMMTREVLGAG